MTAPCSLALQLQHLLGALAQQGNQHLAEVQTDLQQTGFLLAEAIDKLGKSFVGMHAAVAAQQAIVDGLQAGTQASPAQHARLVALQQEATVHVNAAITALQFQDMTSQLIGRIVGHVDSLHETLAEVGTAGATLTQASDDAGALTVLASVNRSLDERGSMLDRVARKAVAQTHMDSGDIELF